MITEHLSINEETKKNVMNAINGDGFSITLEFNEDESIKQIRVYESNKDSQLTSSSACYDGKGNLLSKWTFVYNQEGDISQFTVFDANNTISCKVVYLSNGLTPNCKYFDKFGNEISEDEGELLIRTFGE